MHMKRALCLFLAAVMFVTCFPLTAMAEMLQAENAQSEADDAQAVAISDVVLASDMPMMEAVYHEDSFEEPRPDSQRLIYVARLDPDRKDIFRQSAPKDDRI